MKRRSTKASVAPNFVVQPTWLTDVNRKIDSAGFKLDDKFKAARETVFARELGHRIAPVPHSVIPAPRAANSRSTISS